ncbi:MAG: hypothetical protein GY944_09035 [bacterium]|nr:hypothetical protein [bacterium]
MSHARPVVRGANYALTRRTNYRKSFLAPWHAGVDEAWLYALGHAQQQTGVSLHCASKVIDHHHIDITDNEEKRPEFVRLFHGEVSCALNTLLGRERYDEPGQLWDDRPTHVMRLLDPEAQASHLIYESVQCVAAGLVTRPEHMPGFVFDFGMWKSGAIRVRRPDFYFDGKERAEFVSVTFTPPAQLYRTFGGNLDRLVHHMRRLQTEAVRELNAARKWPVMGAQRIKRIHPYTEPRTRRKTGGGLIPSYKQGARGLIGRRVHIQARRETSAFRRDNRDAVEALRDGNAIAFPYGTYKMRTMFDITVEAPNPALLITGPEPTLDEVKAELRLNPAEADEQRVMLTEVRDAFREESASVVEVDAIELVDERSRVPVALLGLTGRPEAAVKRRFDKNEPPDARSLVVLRDVRRGRPCKTTAHLEGKPTGSDPPA